MALDRQPNAASAGGPATDGGPAPGCVPLDRYDAATALGLAVAALAAYVFTLAPGLLESDSAEFQTLAVTLGYAHPTGYPVYLLLARLATWIPAGDVAYRVNLLSAILASAAAAEAYLLGRLLTGTRWPAVAGAVALAVSPTFWSQAIMAKVYTPALACMLGVLIGLELWRQQGRLRWLFAAACLGGVSLGIHITQGLMVPAALLLLALTPRRWKANWTVATAGALAGAAVTLAAYKVIDLADSPTSYFKTVIAPSRSLWHLEPEDFDSFGKRVRLCLSPPQYRVLLFSKSPEVTWQKADWYFGNLQHEFPWPWLVAAAAGLYGLGRRNGKMTLLLVVAYASHLGYDLIYDMGGIHVLYLATYVPVVLFGAAGLALVGDVCRAAMQRVPRWRIPIAPDTAAGLLGLGVVLWPLLGAGAWNAEGRRDAWTPPEEDAFRVEFAPTTREPIGPFHDRVRELVRDLEPGAVVFTGWCLLYPSYYVAHVEMDRTDLVFLQDYPHPYYFELADSAVAYVRAMVPQRPVYFTHAVRKVAEQFEMTPVRRGRDTLFRVGALRAGPPVRDRPKNK